MLVLWDIDGTLLVTGRAGIFAWEGALRDVVGVESDLSAFDTAGYPDYGIARRLLIEYGGLDQPGADLVRKLVERYEDRLPASLSQRVGRVLPNVPEILTALEREPGICSMLLTGNTRRGAHAKLAYYGLERYFTGGAFSNDEADRVAIAQRALDQAAASGRAPDRGRVVVIGDTPHDIRCARAIGARAVAVATGPYGVPELSAEAPWRTLRELPPAAEFLALLQEGVVVADA
ncbi:MAG TPA: haloacid dehalogenase-like hydrolase [Gemmatimonadales bacterium]|jgi:phosphoglycolate phosphatase-like HAD superfamily hydrolase